MRLSTDGSAQVVLRDHSAIIRVAIDRDFTMTSSTCQHRRTQLIAKDSETQYVECLDCGEIFENGELERQARKEAPSFDESLSDA